MKTKHFFVLLTFFVVVSLVGGVKETQTNLVTTNSLYLEYVQLEYLTVGMPTEINIHVYNQSGVPLTNSTVSCVYQSYNQSGHIEEANMHFDGADFYFSLNTSLYPVGEYYYVIQCVNGSLGGFVSDNFFMSQKGVTTDFRTLFPGVFVLTIIGVVFVIGGTILLFKREAPKQNDN